MKLDFFTPKGDLTRLDSIRLPGFKHPPPTPTQHTPKSEQGGGKSASFAAIISFLFKLPLIHTDCFTLRDTEGANMEAADRPYGFRP